MPLRFVYGPHGIGRANGSGDVLARFGIDPSCRASDRPPRLFAFADEGDLATPIEGTSGSTPN